MNQFLSFASPFSFALSVGDDIDWVPIADLGVKHWNQNEIAEIGKLSPEQKHKLSLSALDIVELLYYGAFVEKYDCITHTESQSVWEHHKPGYYSVKTNYGCCASAASFFSFLYDQCDEIGYVSIVRESGSGHVISYVVRKPYLYFLDPLLYTSGYRNFLIPETGLRKEIAIARYITGCCLRTHSYQSFVKYYNRYYICAGRSHLICKSVGDRVPPVSVVRSDHICSISYPIGTTNLIYCDERKFLYTQIATPSWTPVWETKRTD